MDVAQIVDYYLLVFLLLFDLMLHPLGLALICYCFVYEVALFVFSLIEAIARGCQPLRKLLEIGLCLI